MSITVQNFRLKVNKIFTILHLDPPNKFSKFTQSREPVFRLSFEDKELDDEEETEELEDPEVVDDEPLAFTA